MSKPHDPIISGTRFGKLVVQGRVSNCRGGRERDAKYDCDCDCGRKSTPTAAHLKQANGSKSCGICHKLKYVVPDAAFNRAYRTYKRGAIQKKVSFHLTFLEFRSIIGKPCHYCGQAPVVNSYSADVKVKIPMTGVDRIDSSLGYLLENCVPCCVTCNLAKLDSTLGDFKTWIQRVHTHLFGKVDISEESE